MNSESDLRRIPDLRPVRLGQPFRQKGLNPNIRVLPVVLLIYSFLIFPIEAKVVLGGLNLYAFRIAIIVSLPLLVYMAPRTTGRASSVDLLVAVGSVWIVLSFMSLYGIAEGGVRSLAIVLDTFGAYVIARGSVSSLADLRRILILILPGVVFAAFFFVVESFSRQLLIRPFYTSIFGSAVSYEGGVAKGSLNLLYEIRLGLRRAYSVFSFPILGGVILGSLLPVYLMSGLKKRALVVGAVACGAAFFSLSSATFIVLAIGVGMVLFDRFLPRLRPLRWSFVTAGIAFYGILAEIALQGGIVGVVSRFTLNPATAYIRRLQWRYGGETVMENPLFGIGFAVYEKPAWLTDAIDAHFLGLALRSGLITPVLFAAALLIIMVSLGRNSVFLNRNDRDLVIGLNIMLTVLVFISMTVTFFSEANVFFMITLGVTTSCMIAITRTRAVPPMMRSQRPRSADPSVVRQPNVAPQMRNSR